MSSVLTPGSKCRDRIVGYTVGVRTVGESIARPLENPQALVSEVFCDGRNILCRRNIVFSFELF